MKQLLLTIAVMSVLVGCGPRQDSQTDRRTAKETQVPPAGAAPTRAPTEKGIDVLTGLGFKPDFAYSVAYDLVDKNAQGVSRHRVLLEVMGDDIKSAMDDVEASLVGLGYAKSKSTEGDGRYDSVFVKRGTPTLVFMAQTAERGPALKNPDAVGTIHIMWNAY